MKKIHNYILLSVLAIALASCSEDEIVSNNNQGPFGDSVQFGLSLPEASSRTVYGEESNNAFPLYWVNGDKVQIFSPQCLEGRRSAEYVVSTIDKDGNVVTNQNYASNLTKTGDYGVQWGNTETADFYSLYPSGQYGLSDDGKMAKNIQINYSQNIVVDGSSIKSDMEDCLMYANALEVKKGTKVDLQYNPISTVFWVTLNVPSTSAENFMIQSVSLVAPEGTNIAGTFNLTIANGQFAEWVKGSNSVMAQIADKSTGGYYTLVKGKSLSLPLFLAPVAGLNTKDWKIKVVANSKEYVKTLGGQDIVAGRIHKVTLPNLSTASVEEWDVATWMKYIPRNVYLSEVSIPGSWNSLNADFQSNTSIVDQYGLGVRAFHLDTRWKATRNGNLGQIINPTIKELSVCDGSTSYSVLGADGRVNGTSAKTFASCLEDVVGKVRKDEYMIVFCTFAQDSYSGDNCPSTWYAAISAVCNDNDQVYDASTLTKNTLVGDVLGHVIVIVNLDSSVSANTLPGNSKCLFTYVPMNLPENHYATTTSHIDGLYYGTGEGSGISMYTSHAQISTTGTSAVDCGDRGYSFPFTNRDNLVKSFWDWSKSNYGTSNYNHDKWIYLGLGGNISTRSDGKGDGYDTVENRYAPMVYNRIDEMGKNNVPFYPVGIILMNNKKGSNYTDGTTDLKYGFSDVCKQILLLNNKYRLQFDPNKPTNYDPNYKEPDDFDGGFENGGNEGDEEDTFD